MKSADHCITRNVNKNQPSKPAEASDREREMLLQTGVEVRDKAKGQGGGLQLGSG